MRCNLTKPTRKIAGLLTGLLFAISAIPLGAQPAPELSTHQTKVEYFKTHQVTLNGTIQEVISKRTAHTPAGMHLLVAGPKGVVDAHLGPFMTKATQEALHTGTPVQVVGVMAKLNGKDYLLAREVIFGGRTVTVRSENGFLIQTHKPTSKTRPASDKKTVFEQNGGAR